MPVTYATAEATLKVLESQGENALCISAISGSIIGIIDFPKHDTEVMVRFIEGEPYEVVMQWFFDRPSMGVRINLLSAINELHSCDISYNMFFCNLDEHASEAKAALTVTSRQTIDCASPEEISQLFADMKYSMNRLISLFENILNGVRYRDAMSDPLQQETVGQA